MHERLDCREIGTAAGASEPDRGRGAFHRPASGLHKPQAGFRAA
jgi:hypothetical protein